MIYEPHFLYRLKLVFVFVLVKLKFLQPLLPKSLMDKLPTGWNNHMFWVAFKSGGKKLFFNYYCKMQEPASYKPIVSVDAKYQLTQEDIRAFHENGYIGPFDLGYSEEEMVRIKEHLVDLAVNKESKIFSYARQDYKITDDRENGKGGDAGALIEAKKSVIDQLNAYNRHLEDPILLNLFQNPAITERCAQLLGQDLLLWMTHFFWTPPYSKGSKWHQTSTWLNFDMKESFLQPLNVEELFQLTCWIALTDAPKEKSCLQFVPCSRREIYPVKHNNTNKEGRVYGKYGVEIDYPIGQKDIKLLEAKAGQCIIFCERTIHGSTDNVTDSPRWSVVGRIIRPDTKAYTEKILKDGFDLTVSNVKKVKLDNWKAILLRGEDNFGYNRVAK
ncbi:phytanoyl-CoA dioxygenase family protein [Okeania hirsuta]|uniref:Phytanoyl-CoA dioxygenase family protein n=3 Tax=Okeania TaxID=1458928 RepID=A0A3N6QCS6_9CYAN|nr:phytanoyl-CoA dioxygenase family protein [Okeania hirsuta]RQH16927.1 hypothetical protein D4Z78_18915 [Okeania hirsuta]RQH32389.1 hypothetical protein D5R40_22390 [Okeania hirsuta]